MTLHLHKEHNMKKNVDPDEVQTCELQLMYPLPTRNKLTIYFIYKWADSAPGWSLM